MGDVVFFLHRVYPEKAKDDVNLSTFVRALKLLKTRFQLVPLDAVLAERSGERRAVITFDDGYTDVFVYAYPILKKMKIPAHIFISSGRILPSGVRRNLSDYWDGKVRFEELFRPTSMAKSHEEFLKKGRSREFLSWEELDIMKDVFTFGSHGKDHLAVPCKDSIEDFFDGTNFHWTILTYAEKPFEGLPIFPTRSTLDTRRFFPSPEVMEFCKNFPKGRNWKEELKRKLKEEFKSLGRFESDESALKRIEEELRISKREIEERLFVKVSTFSWPFGQYSERSKKIVARIYDFAFTIKKGFITEDSDPHELPRVSLGKDPFTILGRMLFFSTHLGFKLYKKLRGGKTL